MGDAQITRHLADRPTVLNQSDGVLFVLAVITTRLFAAVGFHGIVSFLFRKAPVRKIQERSSLGANRGPTELDRGAAGDAQRCQRQPASAPVPDEKPEIASKVEDLSSISQDMLTDPYPPSFSLRSTRQSMKAVGRNRE